MKRFFLFMGNTYYPAGGMADFVLDFDTLEEAKDHALTIRDNDWTQIYDTLERKMAFDWRG